MVPYVYPVSCTVFDGGNDSPTFTLDRHKNNISLKSQKVRLVLVQ